MKTTTILSAWTITSSTLTGLPDYLIRPSDQRIRRHNRQLMTFRRALLRRIEAGDRAREALKQVEWAGDYPMDPCFWCDRVRSQGHAPNCSRQLALGIEP